ncbi:MAG: DNA alkylation repair protein [Dehalococcoidales bacterium]|nr:MAG: DNA alkylation repair protein [Dehalococcoidales bacterium]
MTNDVIRAVQARLIENIDGKTQSTHQKFFKEQVLYHGVKMGVVSKLATEFFREIQHLGKDEIFALCEELLITDYGEEAAIAFKWAYRLNKQFESKDFYLFENWLENYVNSWSKCDDFCTHSVGTMVEKYPKYVEDLKRWARSDNRWMRRASAVTLVMPARRGLFLDDAFEIADILLLDEDDLVRKGYGWMLKEVSRLHRHEVYDYVVQRKAVMPRIALRYAIELIPQDMRKAAMSKP